MGSGPCALATRPSGLLPKLLTATEPLGGGRCSLHNRQGVVRTERGSPATGTLFFLDTFRHIAIINIVYCLRMRIWPRLAVRVGITIRRRKTGCAQTEITSSQGKRRGVVPGYLCRFGLCRVVQGERLPLKRPVLRRGLAEVPHRLRHR